MDPVGYAPVAETLTRWLDAGRIVYVPTLVDRAHAGLTGRITLGPEALSGSLLGLAETLVHEWWHIARQVPLEKTASFWLGVATGTPTMARYERPAYRAALEFLTAAASLPDLAEDAVREADAVRATFATEYRVPL